jgi:probable phosphoglycerate mutase
MPPNKEPVVFIARHGRTILNATNKFRGNSNPVLDSVGLEQAQELSDLFKSIDISHIFCSDKIRATKTAEIISSSKNIPVHKSESLRALNVGEFSGQDRNKKSEADLQSYLDDPDTQIPGGESLNDFRNRIRPCLQQSIEIFMDCGVPPLLVAHSSVCHEIGNIATGNHKSILVEPGGAIAVYFDPSTQSISANPIFKPVKSLPGNQASVIT